MKASHRKKRLLNNTDYIAGLVMALASNLEVKVEVALMPTSIWHSMIRRAF
mgnify:CR=1 FL=1